MPRRRTWVAATLTVAALGLTACGSSSDASSTTSSSSATSTTPTTAPASTTTSSVAIVPVTDPSPAGTYGTKPTITVPAGSPPTQLQSTDLITGTGPAVTAGDTVTVQYVGVDYSTGKQFDASWDDGSGQPVSFSLSGVIPGWTVGIVGMKVGGRRELVIPPSLAYGAAGKGPIGPNQTLIFIVDLYKIG
ncbi:MAG: FKBP-type peptidyl-prolyl cis-trans isomerase [Acidimicrobiales bacterium]